MRNGFTPPNLGKSGAVGKWKWDCLCSGLTVGSDSITSINPKIMKPVTVFVPTFLAALSLTVGSTKAQTIDVSDPLVPPGLIPGDTFHFVFVTDKNLSSTADINSFNTYSNDIANNLNGNTGSVVAAIGATWTIIGSGITDQAAYDAAVTEGLGNEVNFLIDAKDNAPITAPVYLISGEKVADDAADMWDGSIDTDIDLQEDGSASYSGVVHTGSASDGTLIGDGRFLGDNGNSRIARGITPNTSGSWIESGNENDGTGRAIYVMSEAITITGSDTTPPQLAAVDPLSPADNAIGVPVITDLSVTFDEFVAFGNGNITLKQISGAGLEAFDVTTSPNLTLSGATVTIDPSSNLAASTGYYVEIDATAIDDLSGNSFAGISGDTNWNFTSNADDVPPTVANLDPTDDATDVPLLSDLVLTFSENVQAGTGNIMIKRTSDDGLVDSIDVTSGNVAISGDEVTIDPSVGILPETTGLYVEIDAGAFEDMLGNSFAGISGSTAWNFVTEAPAPATITVGDPLIPAGLGVGDSFHLVFGMDKDFSSTNTVAAFNAYVTAVANNLDGNTGSVVASLGALWYVIGSEIDTTPETGFTIHARDNALVTAGVYLINGEKVADDFADMWDGTLDTAIDLQKDGVTAYTTLVHTGTTSSGFAVANNRTLGPNTGQSRIWRGFVATDSTWIDGGDETHRNSRGVYALSEAITVVSGGGGNNFSDWIAGFNVGAQTGIGDDPDGDGVDSGVENFFGTAPDSFSQGLVSGTVNTGAGTFTFTHPQTGTIADDLTAAYRWSKDLQTFNADGASDGAGTQVDFTVQLDTPQAGTTTVTATITGTATDRLFVDVEVTQN